MSGRHVIALDLGAESGRVIEVHFDGQRLSLNEVHRFPNTPVQVRDTLHWDILRLWHEIKCGIQAVTPGAAGIGVDTWGVDFALLDRDGSLLANPVHYRDTRTEGMMEWVFERVPRNTLFERTGIQLMVINTLFQLASLVCSRSPILDAAATFVTIPDLLSYWLSGSLACEFTNATTTQCYNPRTGDWDIETLAALQLPVAIFPKIIEPGTRIGEYEKIPVFAPACHDTGSAVVAVPTTTDNFAYLSSGTWSLLGLEVSEPVINEQAYRTNATNEGGIYGTFRLLKNVTGLWLAQQCRAHWRDAGREYSYDELAALAEEAEPFRSLIDPDDALFLRPGDMPARIGDYCQRTNQPIPQTVAQVMRTVYESLALKYRYVLDQLIALTGRSVERLHIIGGGSQNRLLCQMTADAIGRVVVAGPVEATALGNAIVQWIALGEIGDVWQARTLLSRTVDTVSYQPRQEAIWNEAFQRFQRLLEMA